MSPRIIPLRQKQRQQTRAEMIRAAFDLFGKHGYDKVPVEMICASTGISRATFFNYFPQKELILHEIDKARVEKLSDILSRFANGDRSPTFNDIMDLFLEISGENAQMAANSKRLLLDTILRKASQGGFASTKEKAMKALAPVIARIPRRKKTDPKIIAETLFAVYIGTTLEWLMSEKASRRWLLANMRLRLQAAVEGAA